MSSDSDIFRVNKKQLIYCKFFIFFKEKIISLNEEIGKFIELRNSSQKIKKNNFNLVSGNVKKNYKYLVYMGNLLGHGLNITISKKYIKYLTNN
jgi:ribonucleotide reductase beta subunit family protein with ferritin-like domain